MNPAQVFTFYPVHQLKSLMPAIGLGAKRINRARWEAFKRAVDPQSKAFLVCKFFEVLCKQENFQVPLKSTADGTNQFFHNVTLKDLDPNVMLQLVSRDKVRSTLLDNLGISYKTEKVGRQKKVVVELELVANLIKFFDCLEPLKFSIVKSVTAQPSISPRFWVINTDNKEFEKVAGQVVRFTSSIFDDHDEFRETVEKKQQKIISIYPSVPHLLRASSQQSKSAGKTLETYIPLAAEASKVSDLFWMSPTVDNKDQKLIIRTAQELADIAETALKPVKTERIQARRRVIGAARSGKDGTGRRNSTTAATQMHSAAAGFEQAANETIRTSQVNESDYQILLPNYLKAKQFFEVASHWRDEQKFDEVGFNTHAFFSGRWKNPETRKKQLDTFFSLLGLTDSNLSELTFRPFRTFATALSHLKGRAFEMARTEDHSEAQQLLQDLAQLIKIPARVYPHYLRARASMNRDDGINQGRLHLLTYLKELKESFEAGFMPIGNSKRKSFIAQIDRVYSALERWDLEKQHEYLESIRIVSARNQQRSDSTGYSLHVARVETLLEKWTPKRQLEYLKELSDSVDIEARILGWMKA